MAIKAEGVPVADLDPLFAPESVALIGCVEAWFLTPDKAYELSIINPRATYASYYDAYQVHLASIAADQSDLRDADYDAAPNLKRRRSDDQADPTTT